MSEYIYGTDGHEGHWLTGEEIVRCRDCKNFASDELGDFCTLMDFEDVKPMGDGFCSWGERRDG